jgi:hypothetical protein
MKESLSQISKQCNYRNKKVFLSNQLSPRLWRAGWTSKKIHAILLLRCLLIIKNKELLMKIRILFLSLLFVHGISYGQEEKKEQNIQRLAFKDLVEHATFWVKQLPKLAPEEMSLLCNYLYLETLSAYYKCITQRTLISIHVASILMNKHLVTNETDAKNVVKKTIKEFTDLLNELLPAQRFLGKAAQNCLNSIEQSDYVTLKKIIINYQNYCRAIIAQFIKQDKEQIKKVLEQTKRTIDSYVKIMSECSDTLNLIINNENPYIKEGIDKDVTDVDVSMAVTDSTLSCLNETMLICASTKNMNADLISISATCHKAFFNILYQALKDNDTMYPIYLMFDEDGLIEEDERNEELEIFGDKLTLHKKHLRT